MENTAVGYGNPDKGIGSSGEPSEVSQSTELTVQKFLVYEKICLSTDTLLKIYLT